ncbi:MAG TPA: hypothetical protein VHM47_09290, partial [Actinomycetota bacterium]|nr:hypothetical protein [Actinomycetota bacterium]
AVILAGIGLPPSRRLARIILIAGIAVAVILWWISGPVPIPPGSADCVGYPQCYSIGHPYG